MQNKQGKAATTKGNERQRFWEFEVTRGYKRLQEVTRGYKRLQEVTRVGINKENGFWRNRKSFGLPPPNALQNSQLSTNATK